MQKILYVLANFPALSETFVTTEIRAMRAAGHAVTVVVCTRSAFATQPDDGDIAALSTYLADIGPGAALAALVLAGPRLFAAWRFIATQRRQPHRSLLWAAAKIAAIARREDCRHLHAHFAQGAAAHALAAARLLGVPGSFVAHGHDVWQYPEDLGAKLRAATVSLAVCEDLRTRMLAHAPGARVETLPCGVDAERFRPAASAAHNGRLLFIGRLIDGKGADDAIAAIAALPVAGRPHLDIVGTGPQLPAMTLLVHDLALTGFVQFLGAQPSTWIAGHGPGYMALVAPFKAGSDGFQDSSPTVIKEAMAMGLPVVTTRLNGTKEMIDETCGFMTEPGDIPALVRSILQVASLVPSARAALRQAARQRFEARFSAKGQARQLSDIIQAIRPGPDSALGRIRATDAETAVARLDG